MRRLNFLSKSLIIVCLAVLLGYGAMEGTRAWMYIKDVFLGLETVWAHEASDLDVDERITFGRLENGLKYAIMHNEEPPGQVSMRLLIRSGSFMEDEDQRGLAHFLEHMAFNGTKTFSEGELIEYFQRMGMAFGAHTNAHTSLDETVYKLELPNSEYETVNKGLLVFRDFADGMLLDAEAIDRERGVVYSELRDGLSPEWNIMQEQLKFILRGTLVPERMPIGLEEVVLGATKERFDAFYNDWYTVDRMTVVVVGDVDVAQIEEMVSSNFGDMVPADIKSFPVLGDVDFKKAQAKVHLEKNAKSTDVEILVVENIEDKKDTRRNRIRAIKKNFGYGMINDRLEKLRRQPGAVFYEGGAGLSNWFNHYDIHYIGLKCKADDWKKSLVVAEQEMRRVLQHGFSDAEFDVGKRNYINALEQAVRIESTLKSRNRSEGITNLISNDAVITTAEYDLELGTEALEDFSKEECLEIMKDVWGNNAHLIFVSGNEHLEATDEQAMDAYRLSRKVSVRALEEEVIPEFAYQTFGGVGKVVDEKVDKDLNIHQYRFANNVRLNLMPTDFEKGNIAIMLTFGEGLKSLDAKKLGLDMVTKSTLISGGLEAHTANMVDKIYAGTSTGVMFDIGYDAFAMFGGTNSKDLQKQMNLMAAYIVAPGYRESALRLARENYEDFYRKLHTTPDGVASDLVDRWLANDHPHFGIPEKSKVMSHNLTHVQEWLHQPMQESFLEITMVGDFKLDEAKATVANTFGALPERKLTKDLELIKRAQFPELKKKTFYVKSELPKALALAVWPTDDFWKIETARKLSLLGTIYSDRLRKEIREKLGDAYSPYAYNNPSRLFEGYGRFMAVANISPEQADKVTEIMKSIGVDLAEGNITLDEYERAQKPLLVQIKQQERSNSYWISQLGTIQARPEMLKWGKDRYAMYESFTLDDMKAMAKKYLGADKVYQAIIVPEEIKNLNDTSSQESLTASQPATL